MTAEVAILNRNAIAIAADSAVTVGTDSGNSKVYNSVNKIFGLSRKHPVGIMIYNNADFMGVLWETLIKEYRDQLEDDNIGTIKDYGKDFLKFLKRKIDPYFDSECQRRYILIAAYKKLDYLRIVLLKSIENMIDSVGNLSEKDILNGIEKIIDDGIKKTIASKRISGLDGVGKSNIVRNYRKEIEKARDAVFQKLPIDTKCKKKLFKFVVESIFRDSIPRKDYSGIVIVGFGKRELFPAVISFEIYGILLNRIRYLQKVNFAVTSEKKGGFILPLAQREEVDEFICGIHPYYEEEIDTYVKGMLSGFPKIILEALKIDDKKKKSFEKTLKKIAEKEYGEFRDQFNNYQQAVYVNSITEAVGFLPIKEMAEMAEALVNLTSLKRKVSPDQETVGGPTDVAVITKGDGFIWIHRKHYFDIKLNPHFVSRYK